MNDRTDSDTDSGSDVCGVHQPVMPSYRKFVNNHRVGVIWAAFVLLQDFVRVHHFKIPRTAVRVPCHLVLKNHTINVNTLSTAELLIGISHDF